MAVKTLPQGEEKALMVRTMFNRIASRYDVMNRILTFGLDQHWRREALQAVHISAQDIVLDLACGTGDFSALSISQGAKVIGLDFAEEMLQTAKKRNISATFVRGNAASLPLADASIDLVVCGFALRNFIDLEVVSKEVSRVLMPQGRFVFLEVYQPNNPILKVFHRLYFTRVVPLLGALLSDNTAYAYLPRSVSYLPADEELRRILEKSALGHIQHKKLFFGTTQLIIGIRE